MRRPKERLVKGRDYKEPALTPAATLPTVHKSGEIQASQLAYLIKENARLVAAIKIRDIALDNAKRVLRDIPPYVATLKPKERK